jgi:hypothetical protein
MNPIEELNVLRFAADAYRADLKSKFGDSDLITAIADDILRRCDRIQSAIFLADGWKNYAGGTISEVPVAETLEQWGQV